MKLLVGEFVKVGELCWLGEETWRKTNLTFANQFGEFSVFGATWSQIFRHLLCLIRQKSLEIIVFSPFGGQLNFGHACQGGGGPTGCFFMMLTSAAVPL